MLPLPPGAFSLSSFAFLAGGSTLSSMGVLPDAALVLSFLAGGQSFTLVIADFIICYDVFSKEFIALF